MLSVRSLTKVFGAQRDTAVVQDVSFEVNDGEFVTLLGPSGCGKTTTLRCIAGLERPTEGTISIDGQVVAAPAEGIFAPPEVRGLGMVFQSYALWPHMTVYENVVYPLEAKRFRQDKARAAVARALATVDLTGLENRYPAQLSGGQQQRVALARAIVSEPRALLFDEPLSNLDAKLRERMRFELIELQRRIGCAAVYVTHDQAEAMVMSDRIIVMNSGKIQQTGSAQDIYASPANEFVADFIGVSNFVPGTVIRSDENGKTLVGSALGEIVAVGRQFQPAQLVSVMIRPEWIEVAESGVEHRVNQWLGEIEYAVYVGQSYEYVIAVQGIKLRGRTDVGHKFSKGASVYVHFEPARSALLPRQLSPEKKGQ